MAATPALWTAILVVFLAFAAGQGALLRPPLSTGRRLAAGAYLRLLTLPAAAFVFLYLPWPWPFRTTTLTLAGYLIWMWSRPGTGPALRPSEVFLARRALMAAMAAVSIWAAANLVQAPSLSPALVGGASLFAAAACLLPRKAHPTSFPSAEVQ
jgi:hypothetical protein